MAKEEANSETLDADAAMLDSEDSDSDSEAALLDEAMKGTELESNGLEKQDAPADLSVKGTVG